LKAAEIGREVPEDAIQTALESPRGVFEGR
jgi:hypothetical protein